MPVSAAAAAAAVSSASAAAGDWFWRWLARPSTVRQMLKWAYGDPRAVDQELVDLVYQPALQEGARGVLFDVIAYTGGPTVEELLDQVRVPVLLVWGEADPWEPCSLARSLASFPAVEAFEAVPGAGHCVHDERPAEVNRLVLRFLEAHAVPQPAPNAAPAHGTEPS